MIKFIEVTSVEYKYTSEEVFDIEVENEHQYIANDFVVHNCTTSANVGIHYAMGSLIKEIVDIKNEIKDKSKNLPFIVADGGFDNYDKIIKALALGADYVMVGKLFAQTEEACGKVVDHCREYYGMSTKKAQIETGNQKLKTAEGIEFTVPILYKLQGWCENFIDYLRSTMSYTNSRNLTELRYTEYKIISPSEYLSYYK